MLENNTDLTSGINHKDSKPVKVLRISDYWMFNHKWDIYITLSKVQQLNKVEKNRESLRVRGVGKWWGLETSNHDMAVAPLSQKLWIPAQDWDHQHMVMWSPILPNDLYSAQFMVDRERRNIFFSTGALERNMTSLR